jgi:hypothetical protein
VTAPQVESRQDEAQAYRDLVDVLSRIEAAIGAVAVGAFLLALLLFLHYIGVF